LAAFWPNIDQDSSCAFKEPAAMIPSVIAIADALHALATLTVHRLPILIPFHPF
jgi:hypothetical protein